MPLALTEFSRDVSRLLADHASALPVSLRGPVLALVQRRGKGVRSMMLAACAAFGSADGLRLVRLGALVELLHLASLLHDDVVDRATTRRGVPAAHVVVGQSVIMGRADPRRVRQDIRLATNLDEPGWADSASRQATLPAPLRNLHRGVLRRFLDTGAPPMLRWMRQEAAGLGLDDKAADALKAAGLVHIDNEAVSVAYPFSGTLTRQQAELDGFPTVYAMCAIDALGIPAMAGRDGRIAATDPRDGAPSWSRSAAVSGGGHPPARPSSTAARRTAAPTAAPGR